jgi:hypothetical protein
MVAIAEQRAAAAFKQVAFLIQRSMLSVSASSK